MLSTQAHDLLQHNNWFRLIRKPEYRQFKKDVVEATSFLPSGAKMAERLYVVSAKLLSRPVCAIDDCSNQVNWHQDNKEYRSFCTSKCAQRSDQVQTKRANTNIAQFGCANPLQNEDVIRKQRDTMVERYGVEHASQNASIQQKIRDTNLAEYGVEHNCVSDSSVAKKQQTCRAKYGVDSPLESDSVRSKISATVMERYNKSSTLLVDSVREAQRITRDATYDQKFPFMDTLKDKKQLEDMHQIDNKSQTQIAASIGCTQPAVSKWFNKHGIETNITHSSQVQDDILAFVKTIYSGQILINDRTIIAPRELDIVLVDINVAIEVNGVYWHSELNGKDKKYHVSKTNDCATLGYQLIHITDIQWITQQSIVESRLRAKLGAGNTIYARKTQIATLDTVQCREFLINNHIQGFCASSINRGLLYNGELVAIMTFGKARFSGKYQYELLRYCNKLNHSVVGGASKLFTNFIREFNPTSVVSYADISWNTGNMYDKIGFEYSHTSNPNYWYFNKSNAYKLSHRTKFQKHKLESLLEVFDSNDTEWQNMQRNGYDRIWDCGNTVWVYQ